MDNKVENKIVNEKEFEFDIEIVEIYDIIPKELREIPIEKMSKKQIRKIGWSVHAYIGETDQDFRGIVAHMNSAGWFFMMPCAENYDKAEKRWIRFPCLSYTNMKKQKAFFEELKEKFVDFHKQKLIEEGEEKDRKTLAWKEREQIKAEKLAKMSEKRNQNPKYQKLGKR